MKESDIKAVADSLARWNPLGENAAKISDLDGYRTEAIDVISTVSFFSGKKSTEDVIVSVLSEAFGSPLDEAAVQNAAKEIRAILKVKN